MGVLCRIGVAATALCLAGSAWGQTDASQQPSRAEIAALWEGGTWATHKFHGGSWMSGFKSLKQFTDPDFVPPNMIPFNSAEMKRLRDIRIAFGQGRDVFSPYAQCHPAGLPYIFALDGFGGYQAVVGDKAIVMMWGYGGEVRRIYFDGRAHRPIDPANPDANPPTYDGDSIAHWKGKTMVIDTVNLRGENTQMDPHIPKSEGTHVVERYTPVSHDRMSAEVTVTNPGLTRPWVITFDLERNPNGEIVESMCTDGNRYGVAADGLLTMHHADGKPLERAED